MRVLCQRVLPRSWPVSLALLQDLLFLLSWSEYSMTKFPLHSLVFAITSIDYIYFGLQYPRLLRQFHDFFYSLRSSFWFASITCFLTLWTFSPHLLYQRLHCAHQRQLSPFLLNLRLPLHSYSLAYWDPPASLIFFPILPSSIHPVYTLGSHLFYEFTYVSHLLRVPDSTVRRLSDFHSTRPSYLLLAPQLQLNRHLHLLLLSLPLRNYLSTSYIFILFSHSAASASHCWIQLVTLSSYLLTPAASESHCWNSQFFLHINQDHLKSRRGKGVTKRSGGKGRCDPLRGYLAAQHLAGPFLRVTAQQIRYFI